MHSVYINADYELEDVGEKKIKATVRGRAPVKVEWKLMHHRILR